ncbi:hypothetical protein TrST_g615 [Triparma strigata]|uniref:Uncharacterized protein n=1 Tax=Triparma strigata TaxID=1606541 RepID=A0A9W7EMA5_9STRA|nr:hypothetical protein TrST_g615 [Triparma strigata]
MSRPSSRKRSESSSLLSSIRSLISPPTPAPKRRRKKRIYYAKPSQWKVSDFWPEEEGWGGEGRERIDSQSSFESYDSIKSSPPLSVLDSMSQFSSLPPPLHSIFQSRSPLDRYSRRDRARAQLVTGGIKATILEEIKNKANEERERKDVEEPLDTLEGKMSQAAFRIIYSEMTGGSGAGIKVLKHPRSSGQPRKIRIKFKEIEGSRLWLGDEIEEESSDEESVGGDEFGEESGWDHKELKYKVVNKKEKGGGEKGERTKGEATKGEGPYLHYRGGFMNRTKRRMDLSTLVDVKKGIQTDVLRREGGNQYKKHAFLSLLFEGEEERSLDLEVADGDVQVRDKLLHGFKFIVLKNQEFKKAMRAHSWDLDEKATNKKMREAWVGKSRAGENSDGVKVEIGPWLKQREIQRERERAGSVSTETIPDEKKIEENFNVIKDDDLGLPQEFVGLSRNSSSTSELSFSTALGNEECGGFMDSDLAAGAGGIPRQKATVGGFLGGGRGGGGGGDDPGIGLSLEMEA